MKTTLIAITLFAMTAAAVALHPERGGTLPVATQTTHVATQTGKPKIDVVFVLDTTGSMSGLIGAAKEKIWSIATSMASAQPAPEIRIGLVAYRDRGDAYVTRVVDLSGDLDTMYATLMQFAADGGGDGPESVNRALQVAVDDVAWSAGDAYKAIFLVGDAPPHMDYQDDVKYQQTVARAAERGIVVNTIQCGADPQTRQRWNEIASLGHGSFFSVDQAGSAVAITTPYDAELARLSAEFDGTRLYYGTAEEKARQEEKSKATDALHALASAESRARRAAFNVSAAGATNAIGEHELVSDVASGRVDIAAVAAEKLPEPLQTLSVDERRELVAQTAAKRADLEKQIKSLADQRDRYAASKVEADGGAPGSLDAQLFNVVKEQAQAKGIALPAAPKY